MTYCVCRTANGWQIALQAGRQKDVLPETFSSVRAAIKESTRLNRALEAAVAAAVTPEAA